MSERRQPPEAGCYICKPDEHRHDDPSCAGCDQGCCECFGRWLDSVPVEELVLTPNGDGTSTISRETTDE